ncbi:MAG: hypothetical protein SOX74_03560, partial [Candidatus Faecousia sp.]|uniref:hypothetical protein n=1 Tax=Faecousia sp. TaxID=2952921 RepID=UPI002A8B5514|nr:hypothetical protein [Candidatus Faecousia sp.]
ALVCGISQISGKEFCSAMHKNRAGALRPRHDLIICVFVSTPTIDREPIKSAGFFQKRKNPAFFS